MHSTFSRLVAIGLLGSVVLVTGCVTEPTNYDKKFGDSVNAAKAQQTINPDASSKVKPERGLDGQASKAVIDRYHKSFEKPPPPANVFTIGVGSGN